MGWRIDHLNLVPADTARPPKDRFEDRFLGGPSGGEVLGRRRSLAAIRHFTDRINAFQKEFTVLLDHPRDADTFDDLGTHANDFHYRSPQCFCARASTPPATSRARSAPWHKI